MEPSDPPGPPATDDGDLTWVEAAGPDTDAAMAARGLVRVRLLHQMRRPLPLVGDDRPPGDRLPVRAFRPGQDDDAVLRVNNRAFHWHPDQGGWDRARLAARLAEPWVRLEGFLVHEDGGGHVDGFCWTKVHPATAADPAMGEIFVIAADPDAHGTGLGAALLTAGLDHLAGQGLDTAMLYVEADNAAAVRLYERTGFRVHHSDAAYAPAGGPSLER